MVYVPSLCHFRFLHSIFLWFGGIINANYGAFADVVGIDRALIIDAYNWGQGLIGLIAPTGLILVSLSVVNIGFDKWIKLLQNY